MGFKKFHNKILVHMKTFDVDHILGHFVGSKLGLYVSFRIPLQITIHYFSRKAKYTIKTVAHVQVCKLQFMYSIKLNAVHTQTFFCVYIVILSLSLDLSRHTLEFTFVMTLLISLNKVGQIFHNEAKFSMKSYTL